jgi:hypothetical protein
LSIDGHRRRCPTPAWTIGTSRIFPKRTKLAKASYEQVVARWNELVFLGKPPARTVFEDSAPGSSVA